MKIQILTLLLLLLSLNAISQNGLSAELKKAIQSDDTNLLTKAVSPANINDCNGRNSLITLSIKVNALQTLKYLVDQGADPNNSCDAIAPIIHAAIDNKLDFLKVLVDNGADIHSKYRGVSALDIAIKKGHTEIVDYFKTEKGFELFSLDGMDGPYVIGDSVFRVTTNNTIKRKQLERDNPIVVQVNNDDQDQFKVQLKKQHETEKSNYSLPEKLIAISDIEGRFDALYSFLLNNKVIDKDYNWTFGDGHLVLGGDFVDRGNNVTEVLWLLYSLEEKAKAQGGQVHFILGNHELMNIQGDTRYVNGKYISVAQQLNQNPAWDEAYRSMLSPQSELGRWLRSKNSMEKIGDYIFVHAGLSPLLLEHRMSIEKINKLIRKNIDLNIYETPSDDIKINFVLSPYGPLWYRGLVTTNKSYDKITPRQLKSVLKYYKAKTVVIGHTLTDHIKRIQDGQAIMIDVHHHDEKNSGHTMGLLIENGIEYVVDDLGKREKL